MDKKQADEIIEKLDMIDDHLSALGFNKKYDPGAHPGTTEMIAIEMRDMNKVLERIADALTPSTNVAPMIAPDGKIIR